MENIHDKLNYYYYYHFVLYIGSNKCVCQNKSPKKLISCSILLVYSCGRKLCILHDFTYLLAKALWAKILKNCLGFSWKLEFRNSSFLWAETKIFLYNYAQSEIVMVPGRFPESTLEID